MITVEIKKSEPDRIEDEAAFENREAAEEWAKKMVCSHYRVWIDNIEFTRRDF